MALIDFHDVEELKNRQEEKVWAALEDAHARKPGLCRCRDCILDSAAIALNRLPPRYQLHSFQEHENVREEDARQQGAVEAAVEAAIEMVRKRPHHF